MFLFWRLSILICGFSLGLSLPAFTQAIIHYDSGYTWRAYEGTITPPLCPDRLCHNYPKVSWNNKYTEFTAWFSETNNPNTATDFMNFRVVFPPGYKKTDLAKKYPLALFLHGAGESGRVWQGRFNYLNTDPNYDNNSANLTHGGNEHQLAVNKVVTDPRAFPGIVVFPQASYSGAWSDAWDNGTLSRNQEYIIGFLEHLIDNYNVEINQISIEGLSNGAKGTWDTAMKRPDLFCAVQPFSGVPNDIDLASDILLTTPIRLYQGGRDLNPSPGGAQTTINSFISKGGTPEYILYPTLGHGTWVTAMAKSDFFSWILAQDKRKIYIFGGSTGLCSTPGATKMLGFSDGFIAYQWTKDGVNIPGETTRYITITATGIYTVKFQRNDSVWYESFPTTIVPQGSSTYSPLLTNTGSLILPYTQDNGITVGSIGQTFTILQAPTGYSQYNWYKDGALVISNSSNTRQISQGSGSAADAGVYTVSVKEGSGCESLVSNAKTLIYNTNASNPPNTTGPWHTSPSGVTSAPVLTILSENKIRLNWTESIANEEYFEIWRYRRNNSGSSTTLPGYSGQDWVAIAQVPANTTTYTDETGLRPAAEYGYVIRAMANNDGRFSAMNSTAPSWPKTLNETQAPTAPSELTLVSATETTLTMSWIPSIDNDVIFQYEVFLGTVSKGLLKNDNSGTDQSDGSPAPPTTYTFTGLDPASTYLLNVRAIDYRGNKSSFPEALVANTTYNENGLSFKYYTYSTTTMPGTNGSQLAEPQANGGFNFASATPVQTGKVTFFDISGANTYQGVLDPTKFVYAFDGFIQIDVAGNYRFYTSSSEGSRLYIDGVLIVNNDGTHTSLTPRNGPAASSGLSLTVGRHAIRVTYFEQTRSNITQLLQVRYSTCNSSGGCNPGTMWSSALSIPNNKLFLTGTVLVNYYSKATGNLESLATWGTNTNGSGIAPANFTSNYQIFNIANRIGTTSTLANPWTVSGASSRVVLGTNTALTLDAVLTAKLYANAGSTINLNHATLPELVQLDPTSTVNMNVAGMVPSAVYGNLNLKTAATAKTLSASSTLVKGAMAIDDQVTLNGASANQSTLSVTGNITFNGSSSVPPVNANLYSLQFKGGQPHTVNVNQTDLALFALDVDYGSTVNFNFNDAATHTVSVGLPGGSGGLFVRTGSSIQLGQHNLIVNGVSGINPTDDYGVINMNGGDITINTTSGQTSNLSLADASQVKNFSFVNAGAGQLNLLNSSTLTNLMSLNGSSLNVLGNLTLKSDATGTARIGPIATGSRINGEVSVQRFMEGEGRIYRYISSSVKGVKASDLQQYFPITGNFTGASTGPGLTSGNVSMFHYNEPTPGGYIQFPAVGGTNADTLRTGKGYSPFIRQDVASTTWQIKGAVNQGNISFALTPDSNTNSSEDGYNLLGNPYPAPIKWTGGSTGGWTMTGVGNTVWVRENWNGGFQFRAYNGSVGNLTDGVIAPGQAFWIQTTSASPQLTISETAKQVTDGAFYRVGGLDNTIEVTMKSTTNLEDATYIQFVEGASTAYEKAKDAIKRPNSFFNLSTLSADGKELAINLTQDICVQEIKIRTSNASAGTYVLTVNGADSFIAGDKVTLSDNFLQTETVIDNSKTITFNITSDLASKADGRFTLKFEKPAVSLNQGLSSVAGCEQTDPVINVANSQVGVQYQAFYDGQAISAAVTGTGQQLVVPVDHTLIGYGKINVAMGARFKNCQQNMLTNTVKIALDTLAVPSITMNDGVLIATIENAQYRWFHDEVELIGQTAQELDPTQIGSFTVEVTSGGCTKLSQPLTKFEVMLDLQLGSTSTCDQNNPTVWIVNSQADVEYRAYYNNILVSQRALGTGDSLAVSIDRTLIGEGEKEISIQAGFKDDKKHILTQTTTLRNDNLSELKISSVNGMLKASIENANYRWFLNGVEIPDQTNREIEPIIDGVYTVEVALGACTKLSDPIDFLVTGIPGENETSFCKVYPNPTKGKVVVSLKQSVELSTVYVHTILGQAIQIAPIKVNDQSVEVDFTELPNGLYLLQVNGYRFRVIKE